MIKCRFCGHDKLRKNGFRHLKDSKKQKYQCLKCKNSFILDSRGVGDYVKCLVCNNNFLVIRPSHLSKHNLSMRRYKKRFPGCKLATDGIKEILLKQVREFYSDSKNIKKMSEIRKKWYKDNPEKVKMLQKNRMKVLKSRKFRILKSKSMKEYYENNPKIKEIISKKVKVIMNSPERKEKMRRGILNFRKNNPGLWKEIENKRLRSVKTKKFRKKRSEFMKNYFLENSEKKKEWVKMMEDWRKSNPNKWKKAVKNSANTRRSSKFRKKVSKIVKNYLESNPEYKKRLQNRLRNMFKDEEAVKKMVKSLNIKPNRLESKLIHLFKEKDIPYKFVGDFKLLVNGRNPDFVHSDGKKKIIELFGNYWHSGKRINHKSVKAHIEDRKNHFKKQGYDTLIIWGSELKDMDKVVQKVELFENKPQDL